MDSEQEKLERDLEEAKSAALDIEDGKRSRYWKHLEKKIAGWLEAEKKHLDLINLKVIRTNEDLEDRNDSVKRIGILTEFLGINEIIREEKLGLIGAVRPPMPEFIQKKQPSFVGPKPTEANSNGRS